jgi:predicted ATPase
VNGAGKTNLYRTLQLLQASALGRSRACRRRWDGVGSVGRKAQEASACSHLLDLQLRPTFSRRIRQ